MLQAIELARQAEGRTSPNPPVGALLVRDGQVVGQGFHPKAGEPHAEIFALRDAGEQASGADLYVTLEPCCHHGRTGPCTEALIKAGVQRVFVGTCDPNPDVAGRGLIQLREAGIPVECGLLEDQCRRLIAPFSKHVTTGLPFVILKTAMTLDGQIATRTGDSQWISGAESRTSVHRLRDRVDAIMVGSGTVLADNPRLTTRLPEGGGHNPARIIVDGGLVTPLDAEVYTESSTQRILITTAGVDDQKINTFRSHGVEVIEVTRVKGCLDLAGAMDALGALGVQTILLEGGSGLNGAMMRAGLVDRVMIFIGPMLFGGDDGHGIFSGPGVERLQDAFQIKDVRVSCLGPDVLVEGEIKTCLPD
jgi:diaminohydroxyphosphoribosylaminopyrimidine deaminase/5-amino-6-(5-phosphoribosylamino)uracil reductase